MTFEQSNPRLMSGGRNQCSAVSASSSRRGNLGHAEQYGPDEIRQRALAAGFMPGCASRRNPSPVIMSVLSMLDSVLWNLLGMLGSTTKGGALEKVSFLSPEAQRQMMA
jgi:hypothetical protein